VYHGVEGDEGVVASAFASKQEDETDEIAHQLKGLRLA